MSLHTHTRTPGRRLMVLDDAETIARQARRRAALRRRQQERRQRLAAVLVVLAIVAVLLGAPLLAVLGIPVVAALLAVPAVHGIRERQATLRRRSALRQVGPGIGTPRPKGGFSTTRHRTGAPVWITARPGDRAA